MQYGLTIEQVEAIHAYAKANGRAWKSALRADWESGGYVDQDLAPYLQQVRNNFGPRWLQRYRLTLQLPR